MEIFEPEPKYRSYHDDINDYLDALMAEGLVESGLHKQLGVSPYQIAQQPIFDAYARRQLWTTMARDYLIHSHETENDLVISRGLVDTGDFANLQQLWRTYLASARSWYWNNREMLSQGAGSAAGGIEWEEVKRRSIAAFETYRGFVSSFSAERELDWIEEEIDSLKREEARKPRLKKPLPDKVDEERFWQILDTADTGADGATDLLNGNVVDQLQDYRATEIKRFQNLLLDKLEALNHWDLWAVAYLSQDGCSENSFEHFRAWLISRGKDVFELAQGDVKALLSRVPKDGFVMNEGLLYAAYEAYEIRSGGNEMEVRERKYREPGGDSWTDEDVASQYADVARFYERA